MARHALDEGVFIRSLATRGHLGRSVAGHLSRRGACPRRRRLRRRARGDRRRGAGRARDRETPRTRPSWSPAPGLGDEVQAVKAGILECADVFAVNKADNEGADTTVRDLELMIALGNESIRTLSRSAEHRTHTAADAPRLPIGGSPRRERARLAIWRAPIVEVHRDRRGRGIRRFSPAALDRHRSLAPGLGWSDRRGGATGWPARSANRCAKHSSRPRFKSWARDSSRSPRGYRRDRSTRIRRSRSWSTASAAGAGCCPLVSRTALVARRSPGSGEQEEEPFANRCHLDRPGPAQRGQRTRRGTGGR